MKRNVNQLSLDLKKQASKILLLIAFSITIMSVGTMKGSENNTAAPSKLTGIVVDAATEAPLEGAVIQVKGTEIIVVTDKDGKYSIKLPKDAKSIIVSFIGYMTLEIGIAERTEINVALSKLEEDPAIWGM